MGVYGMDPRNDFYDRGSQPLTDAGGGHMARNLADRFSGLGVGSSAADSSKDSLVQVMKAVEDAENTIKQQLEENNQLRDELMRKSRELDTYKLGAASVRTSDDNLRDEHTGETYNSRLSNSPFRTQVDRIRWMDNGSSMNAQGTLIIHQNGIPESDDPSSRTSTGNQHYSESSKVNGTGKVFPGMQTSFDSAGLSQFSTPSSRSLSPNRQRKEGEYDPRLNLNSHGLIPMPETNSNNLWKQDLIVKVRQHEEEIVRLKKHLADYSIKEAQIRNEKYSLEKRIAYMRMAFDQQQQDLVDAASKALSYRQDIIEENIRLTYALQVAQQERSTFMSSLLPFLSEYSLQPPVLDAQSIVSNLKEAQIRNEKYALEKRIAYMRMAFDQQQQDLVDAASKALSYRQDIIEETIRLTYALQVLFKHLQEKLFLSEEKLKESQYQLVPIRAESSNNMSFPLQSLPYTLGTTLATSNPNGLEIVPQPAYSHAQSPSSPSNGQTRANWDALANQNSNTGPSGVTAKNLENDNLEKTPVSVSRNPGSQDPSARANQGESHSARFNAESNSQHPSFKDLVKGNETDDSEVAGLPHAREPSVHWASGGSPYTSGLDDPNSSYPYLPPVLEEPSSSFSEAADDDPLPAIEGLQISGEAFPGRELLASGYSINGTTSCNFEWVRYLEDGSVNYIEGAKQPKYLVTADDVDTYLAIEVQPLDDRKQKGELVKVLANEGRKITCDPEMQEQIVKAHYAGHVSYEVSLSAGVLDIWEHAILAIKREGYSIKCNGPRGVVVTEKFLPETAIIVPYGHPTEFIIQSAATVEYLLRTPDNSSLRDTIVLTMRFFKMRAAEKRKGRKKGLFFK